MQREIDESPEKARSYSGIPGSGPPLGIEDVERLVHHTVEHTLEDTINGVARILFAMDVGLMVTDDPVGFITSDAPVVPFDPDATPGSPFRNRRPRTRLRFLRRLAFRRHRGRRETSAVARA